MKNHLKRIAAPRNWKILRKANVFVTCPKPGAHSIETSVPFTIFCKDMARIAANTKDVKYLINNKTIKINGLKVKGYRQPVGIMDSVTIDETGQNFRILLNTQGKLIAKETDESNHIVQIKNKAKLKGNRTQLNFNSGGNLIVEKDEYKTGDSLILEGKNIKEHIPLQKGAYVFLTGGRHKGNSGVIDEIQDDKIIYKNDGQLVETDKQYAFVIGTKKPQITM
ncbi:MAG: KOW motif-containing protein [Candidatus Woesearchaeota archaeon]